MPCARLLIADEHAVARIGLRQLVERQSDLCVAGEAASGADVLQRLAESAFDLLVASWTLAPPSGAGLLLDARRRQPSLRVLVMSTHPEPYIAEAAYRSGASGYIGKDADEREFLAGMRRVLAGEQYLAPGLAKNGPRGSSANHGPRVLTRREIEVLKHYCSGRTNREIANTLLISEKTVASHKARLRAKLGGPSAVGLMRCADQHVGKEE